MCLTSNLESKISFDILPLKDSRHQVYLVIAGAARKEAIFQVRNSSFFSKEGREEPFLYYW